MAALAWKLRWILSICVAESLDFAGVLPPTWTSPTTTGDSPSGRYGHTAVMDDAGKMWIFGGDSSNGYPRSVYCLDTQATPPRWTSPATNGESPAGRFGHSAVMDGTGKMWIFGGRPSSSSSSFLDDVHVLDTQATPPTWTSPTTSGDSPGARFGHSAVMDGTGKMWIFGGDRNGFLDDVFTLQTEVDPPEWANQNLTNPLGRYGHTAVIEANGKMWIFGETTALPATWMMYTTCTPRRRRR